MNQKLSRSLLLIGIITISAYIGGTFAAKVITPLYHIDHDLNSKFKDINQEEECCGHIDVTPPSVTLISPLNNSSVTEGTVIDLNVIDADSSVNQVLYHWEKDQTNVTLDFPYDVIIPNQTGLHVLLVYSEDSNGNWASAKFIFTVPSFQTTITEVTTTQQTTKSESTSGFDWVVVLLVFNITSILFFISHKKGVKQE
ncbi:MAG: hypothetical protein JSW11_07495 [Candidatus Heimdallarchaeota archaeon]|nr:MAG: hypothetical protein JSW11_07495 [Candidatus Heimdallarchaeota archaeon]